MASADSASSSSSSSSSDAMVLDKAATQLTLSEMRGGIRDESDLSAPAAKTRRLSDSNIASGRTTINNDDSQPPTFFFRHLTEWFKGRSQMEILTQNPYKEYHYCTDHDVWCEAYPMMTLGKTMETKVCGMCLPNGSITLYYIISQLLQKSDATIQNSRIAWITQTKKLAELRDRGNTPSGMQEPTMKETKYHMVSNWIVYECLVWELAESTRRITKQEMKTGLAENEEAKTPSTIKHVDIFREYMRDAEVYRMKDSAKLSKMYCFEHKTEGDAVPWRHPSRYKTCLICPKPHSQPIHTPNTMESVVDTSSVVNWKLNDE
jgi:hypothetical protein